LCCCTVQDENTCTKELDFEANINIAKVGAGSAFPEKESRGIHKIVPLPNSLVSNITRYGFWSFPVAKCLPFFDLFRKVSSSDWYKGL
jgi:hypothetical protein